MLKFDVNGVSDIGSKEINQDNFVYKTVQVNGKYAGLFAVADGVGGLNNGEIASAMAISEINKWWEKEFITNYCEKNYLFNSLIRIIENVNKSIIDISKEKGCRMATTLSILFLYEGEAIVVNIGDSRIYRAGLGAFAGRLYQITEDHSCIVEKEVNGKTIRKNVLTQCIGNKDDFEYFSAVLPIKKDDIFIVCSDGIYKRQSLDSLLKIISKNKRSTLNICEKMIEEAKKSRETDNITVIAIRVYE